MADNNEAVDPAIPPFPPNLLARGRRLWTEMHASADFSNCPETRIVLEEACYLADEINRLRRIVKAAGTDTRVAGYNGQPVTMPEVDDLRKNQNILLAMLKTIRLPDEEAEKMSRSAAGRKAANTRWGNQ